MNQEPALSHYGDFSRLKQFEDPGVEAIRRSILEYVACLRRLGRTAKPFADESLPLLRKAKRKARIRAALYLNLNIEVLKEVILSGEPVDDRRLMWRILAKAKLTPTSDLLEYISPGDLVELYILKDQVQIFRNLRFFDISSLSIETLLFSPWYKFSKRPVSISLSLLKLISWFRLSNTGQTVKVEIPRHVVHEIAGDRRNNELTMKWLSPCLSQGKVVAAVAIGSVRRL